MIVFVFSIFYWGAFLGLERFLFKNFLMGCFPIDFEEVKRPLRTRSVKRPIKVGKRPINGPLTAMVLVGISVGRLVGCLRAPPPWRKTAPLKGPLRGLISRSTKNRKKCFDLKGGHQGLMLDVVALRHIYLRFSDMQE